MMLRNAINVLLLGFAVIALAQSEAPAPTEDAAPKTRWEDYQVVVERSIFSRDRRVPAAGPPTPVDTTPVNVPPPAPLQSHFVLIGVSIIDDKPVVFIEDRRSAAMHTLGVGDELAERRIVAIALDQVSVTPTDGPEASAMGIDVGRTLTGEVPATLMTRTPVAVTDTTSTSASTTTTTSSTAATTPTTEPTATSGDGELSILERLRLRRQQETQQ